jgi:tetratricopeptide (TPR) repeat protein
MYSRYAKEGMRAAEAEDILMGLHCFEQIPETQMSALVISYYGYCLARERRAVRRSLDLLTQALTLDCNDPLIYLNLGRVQQIFGAVDLALESFRQGLRIARHPLLIRALEKHSLRRSVLFPFLQRGNIVNVVCGKFLSKLF